MVSNLSSTSQVVVKFIVNGIDETVPFRLLVFRRQFCRQWFGDYEWLFLLMSLNILLTDFLRQWELLQAWLLPWNKTNFLVRVGSFVLLFRRWWKYLDCFHNACHRTGRQSYCFCQCN